MKLSPLDIRKQEFTRGFRGYDADEVDAFLQMVSSQWEELLDARRRLEQRVEDLEGKVRHYERVEEALQEALATARQNARQIVDGAHHKAQSVLNEAEAKALDIKRAAEEERVRLKREISRLGNRQDEVVARLRAFLMSELELLARFEGDDPIGFIKLLPPSEAAAERAGGERPAPRRLQAGADDEDLGTRRSPSHPADRTTDRGRAERTTERDDPEHDDPDRGGDRAAGRDTHERRTFEPSAGGRSAAGAAGDEDDAPRSVPPPEARPTAPEGIPPTPRRAVAPASRPAVRPAVRPAEADDAEPDAADDLAGSLAPADDEDAPQFAGTTDEIERIRRILRDLD